jgi:hypothetical protein
MAEVLVVAYMNIASSMVVPAADGVDEPGRIKSAYPLCEFKVGTFLRRSLTPVFVVDGLRFMR